MLFVLPQIGAILSTKGNETKTTADKVQNTEHGKLAIRANKLCKKKLIDLIDLS